MPGRSSLVFETRFLVTVATEVAYVYYSSICWSLVDSNQTLSYSTVLHNKSTLSCRFLYHTSTLTSELLLSSRIVSESTASYSLTSAYLINCTNRSRASMPRASPLKFEYALFTIVFLRHARCSKVSSAD